MSFPQPENRSFIPQEWKGYCDTYLEKLISRFAEIKSQKGSEALQRAVNYFTSNPDALLREVQTQFELRPSYFGVGETNAVSSEAVASTEPVSVEVGRQKRQKDMGPEEAAIIDDIEQRFASEELLEAIKNGRQIRGTKS